MSKPGSIFKQMSTVMAAVKAVGKNGDNLQQGFKYRKIEDVADMMHELLADNNIYILPEVLDEKTEERTTSRGGNLIYRVLKVKFEYVSGIDGSRETSIVTGEGMDSGDKASNKAMTAAFKYSLSQVFCLPFGSFVDPDQQSHPESSPKKAEPKAEPKKGPKLEEQLVEKMAEDGVNNASLLKYCQGKGWLPENSKPRDLSTLPDELVGAMLKPENWAKVKAACAPKPEPPSEAKQEPPKREPMSGESNTFHAGLYTLMELSGISRESLHKYLVGKGYITENTVIDNLPQALVDEMVKDENWNKIADAIKKVRKS